MPETVSRIQQSIKWALENEMATYEAIMSSYASSTRDLHRFRRKSHKNYIVKQRLRRHWTDTLGLWNSEAIARMRTCGFFSPCWRIKSQRHSWVLAILPCVGDSQTNSVSRSHQDCRQQALGLFQCQWHASRRLHYCLRQQFFLKFWYSLTEQLRPVHQDYPRLP